MPHRAASPAASENEFDLTGALFGGDTNLSDSDDNNDLQISAPSLTNGAIDVLDDGFVTEGEDDAAFIAKKQASANKKGVKLQGKKATGGSFQAMGLDSKLLKAIARKGFSLPTPIQRKAIPVILDGQDVVASARTGSGKTAAFAIPMIQQLKAHKTSVGARALILSPSRELALQTVKVVNELGKGTDLRSMLVVGGDSMEDQFKAMTSNPDIIIATPGRFLHLQMEMGLDLSSFTYVVFDEADRLFEMGFAPQLGEILHALPTSRQTLLFSATLPKSLVEFVRAGLSDPKLVRLDAETKVSSELENAFFYVKSADKEGALLHILNDVIQMPAGPTEAAKARQNQKQEGKTSKKRKRGETDAVEKVADNATIIFVATKHHVEYITSLLRSSGFSVSYLYSSLDQTARKINTQLFRSGQTSILVVTDIAARGVDIPILSNVINYDFASSAKLWVHRVGRTARAGRRGWSYNLVTIKDLPYMLDLQLFLSKRLLLGRADHASGSVSYAEDMVAGTLARHQLESNIESVNKLLEDDEDLAALRTVAAKGEKLYTKTRNSASLESVKRSKDILANPGGINELHLLFEQSEVSSRRENESQWADREALLQRIRGFRPEETVFEVGKRGGVGNETADLVRRARERMEPRRQKHHQRLNAVADFPSSSKKSQQNQDEAQTKLPQSAIAKDSAGLISSASERATAAARKNGRNSKLANAGESASRSSSPGYIPGLTRNGKAGLSLIAASDFICSEDEVILDHADDNEEDRGAEKNHVGHAGGEFSNRDGLRDAGMTSKMRQGAGQNPRGRDEHGDLSDDDELGSWSGGGKGPRSAEGTGEGAGEKGLGEGVMMDWGVDMGEAEEDELEVTFGGSGGDGMGRGGKSKLEEWEDDEHFMSYTPRHTNLAEDRALSVHKGSGNAADFLMEARGATLDMGTDESKGFKEASRPGMRWDKKGKKYVSRANDLDGSKEGKAKYIKGESGHKIAASFKSGRFEAWKKRERIEKMPRVGEREAAGAASNAPVGRKWKHKGEKAPKEADRWRDDYHVRKKRVAEAREKRVGRFREGGGKSEIKSLDDIAKGRREMEKRREKNGRPQRKGRK